eukprot:gene9539-6696_t
MGQPTVGKRFVRARRDGDGVKTRSRDAAESVSIHKNLSFQFGIWSVNSLKEKDENGGGGGQSRIGFNVLGLKSSEHISQGIRFYFS